MKGFASKYFGILTLNNDKCDFKVFLVFIWYFQFVQKHSCIQLKAHQCAIRHTVIPQSRPGISFWVHVLCIMCTPTIRSAH